jgi:uncharacterized damage-inducible protein DinB
VNLLVHARRMARYNQWMNERLYACCATLTRVWGQTTVKK